MKTILLVLCLLVAGCDGVGITVGEPSGYFQAARERPVVNLPISLREANWNSTRGGSCTHACQVTLLRFQNRSITADWWRAHHAGGETHLSLAAKLDAAGIRYASTVGLNDVSFLEWSIASRRGCGVTVLAGRHMVCLVWLDAETAGILDPNEPDKVSYVPRNAFLKEWELSGSWGITPAYSPIAPLKESK